MLHREALIFSSVMSSTWPNASRADQSEVNLTFKGQNLPLSSQGTCACALYTKPLIDLGLSDLEARSMHVCGTMFHFAGQVSWYWKLGCVIHRSCWLLSRLCFSASVCSQGISILVHNVRYCQDFTIFNRHFSKYLLKTFMYDAL